MQKFYIVASLFSHSLWHHYFHIHCGITIFTFTNVKGTNAVFMERASWSLLPFGIEKLMSNRKAKANKLDLAELVIDLYDGAISAYMKTGTLKPKTVPAIATGMSALSIVLRWRDTQHKHCVYCHDSLKVKQTVLTYVAIDWMECLHIATCWRHTQILLHLLRLIESGTKQCLLLLLSGVP